MAKAKVRTFDGSQDVEEWIEHFKMVVDALQDKWCSETRCTDKIASKVEEFMNDQKTINEYTYDDEKNKLGDDVIEKNKIKTRTEASAKIGSDISKLHVQRKSINAFRLSMIGPMQSWVASQDPKCTIETLFTNLLQHQLGPNYLTHKKRLALDLKRSDCKNLQEYHSRKVNLLQKSFTDNKFVLDQYIEGLTPKTKAWIYKEVDANRDSLDKCFRIALAMEEIAVAETNEKALLLEEADIHDSPNQPTTPKNPKNPPKNEKICRSCGQNGHFSASYYGCANHDPDFRQRRGGRYGPTGRGAPDNRYNNATTNNNNDNANRPTTYAEAKRRQICGYCGKQGHSVDSCFTLPKDFQ